MCKTFIAFFSGFAFLVLPLVSHAQVGPFDVAINNGRVIDPQSGLDASRHIGIIAGRIVAISETALRGDREIDASGLVVAPGFVDIHAHGQSEEAYRLMVQDGVTSGFELEIGTDQVGEW